MRNSINRIKMLIDLYSTMLEKERRDSQEIILSILESLRILQGDTADRRLQQLTSQLRKLHDQINKFVEISQRDFISKIEFENAELMQVITNIRVAALLTSLMEARPSSLNSFCQPFLDGLIKAVNAERGFILFYAPASTEADIIAARNFQTKNLSLEEYDFSRTLLKEVLQHGKLFLLEDASNDPVFSMVTSVRDFGIKSVLAAPLKQHGKIIGALYLENNKLAYVFNNEDLKFLETMASFAVFYLDNTHLLPPIIDSIYKTMLDNNKAPIDIIGNDVKIVALRKLIERIADLPATVLIEGESGTGKDLVARKLHYQSSRRTNQYVAINCAAIPKDLLESELFGHEEGSFTGAVKLHKGHIEQAHEGTLFLDEISEMPYHLQAKLLRFLQPCKMAPGELQTYELRRVGSNKTLRIKLRIVAATSKNLKAMVGSGDFQEALFYRLNVIRIQIPPLRERKEDIPLLARYFTNNYAKFYKKPVRIDNDVYELLKEYSFPGNVRELENLIHSLVALANDTALVRVGDLPNEILQSSSVRILLDKAPLYKILQTQPIDLKDLRNREEELSSMMMRQKQQLAEKFLQIANNNKSEAARMLGIDRTNFIKWLKAIKQ
ncbi:MAG: sigma-54-dependent Fis family transcriptional regulator [Acidobacteriota bacterium]